MSEQESMAESELSQSPAAPQYNEMSFMESDISQDVNALRKENRELRSTVHSLRNELQEEQDKCSALKKKQTSIDKDIVAVKTKALEDVERLDDELTRHRKMVEKAEEIQQNLVLEVDKVKRDMGSEINHMQKQLHGQNKVMENMKQELSEKSRQVEMLLEEVENCQQIVRKQEELTHAAGNQRDAALASVTKQQQTVETLRGQLESTERHHNSEVKELEDRINELEDEGRLQTDALRRQVAETELIREKADRVMQELQSSSSRVKSLEESIEAERAAHLESKFNSEIIQMRIRDLEGVIEQEKEAKTNAIAARDKINKQIRELQKVYDAERKSGQNMEEKIKQAEQEYAGLTKQLQGELDDKREIINRLSSELDTHAQEFSSLKTELNKAKKRQVYLEETYSGCMKELELLLDNFRIDSKHGSKPLSSSSKHLGPPMHVANRRAATKSAAAGVPPAGNEGKKNPTVILEGLKHTLLAYKRKCEDYNSQLVKVTAEHDSINKDNSHMKAQILANNKTLEGSKKSVSKLSSEVSQLKEKNRELHQNMRDLKTQLETQKKNFQRESKEQSNKQEQMTVELLRGLYHRLLVGLPHDLPVMEQKLPSSVTELTSLLHEQSMRILTALKTATDSLHELEGAAGNKEEIIGSMRRAHEEQLLKLRAIAEKRTSQWQQQKQQMEEQYEQLITQLKQKLKESQELADKGWEQCTVSQSTHELLEVRCGELETSLAHVQQEHDTLLTTCALLSGALASLAHRNVLLAQQRAVLVDHANTLEAFKTEVQQFTLALSPEPSEDDVCVRRSRAVLRFRAGVVAVIAANRLLRLSALHRSSSSDSMCVVRDAWPGISKMTINAAHTDNRSSHNKLSESASLVRWLTSAELKAIVMTCVADLQATLQTARQGGIVDACDIAEEARLCMERLLRQLSPMFPSVNETLDQRVPERGSLIRTLHHGLNAAMYRDGGEQAAPGYESSQATLSTLQGHVVEFTRRLHGAEVERRSLRQQILQLTQQQQQMAETQKYEHPECDERDDGNNGEYIEKEKFDHICEELANALKREQQASRLLQEQSQQVERLSKRVDSIRHDGSQKETLLTEAVQGLTEAKMELKRHEQRERNLTRQLKQIDGEKKMLQENIADAEKALRTASRDRDALAEYVNNIMRALQQIEVCAAPDYSPLLQPNMHRHSNKPGPEVSACQRLVNCFVDMQRQVSSRAELCLEEVKVQKEHIEALKRELSNACRREYENEAPIRQAAADDAEKQHFMPLIEDLSGTVNSTYSMPSMATPPTKHMQKSAVTKSSSDTHNKPHKQSRKSGKGKA